MIKGSVNVKTIIVGVILVLVIVLGVLGVNTVKTYMSGAAAETEPKNVIAEPDEDGKSASVSWVSDKATQGVVEYGTNPASLLLRAVETEATTDHKILLSPLKSGVTYYYRIRIGEEIFDNSGVPYTFKVANTGNEVVPTVAPIILAPTVAVASPSGAPSCNRNTDYNNDGVINSVDYNFCLNGSKAATPSTALIPTVAKDPCNPLKDLNNDGSINSLDRIKCLQNNKI
jgi:hypothetical protein